jgi:RNA polymerase sigma factor FliA
VNDVVEQPLTIQQHQRVLRALHVIDDEALKLKRRYGTLVDVDDLASEGKLALYDCARRFDEKICPAFEPYARLRVRGAMLNHLKCETRYARVVREMRVASAESVADYHDDFDILRHTAEEFQRRIDLMCQEHAAAMFLAGAEQAKREAEHEPEAAREYAHAIAVLAEVVKPLAAEDRRLLDMIYASNFNLDQAADDLGVSRKTAWRRLHRVLDQLRRALVLLEVRRAPPPMDLRHTRHVLVDRTPGSKEADDEPLQGRDLEKQR